MSFNTQANMYSYNSRRIELEGVIQYARYIPGQLSKYDEKNNLLFLFFFLYNWFWARRYPIYEEINYSIHTISVLIQVR